MYLSSNYFIQLPYLVLLAIGCITFIKHMLPFLAHGIIYLTHQQKVLVPIKSV